MDTLDLFKIAKNDSYELAVHRTKNYLIISLLGIWDKMSQLDNYLDDIKSALQKVSEGFNLIIDLRQYRGSSAEYFHLHIEAQTLAINSGLNKTAVVLKGNPMLKVTVDYIFKQSGINNATYFDNISAAEYWLSL